MKKIISKSEFLEINNKSANKMFKNSSLRKNANKLLYEADKYRWIHQAKWLGEPVLNLPQDMFAIQELILSSKPDYIIEIGVAWGGSILFNSMLLDYINGKKVIGVDIFIPNNLKKRLGKHKKLSKKFKLIEGDSLSESTFKKIKKIIKNSKKVMVILDSHHTHDHVLKELELYSKLVSKNNYLICCDTIINFMPIQSHRKRQWGPNNNPFTALKEFLSYNKRFKINRDIEKKLLFSCNPSGYLIANK